MVTIPAIKVEVSPIYLNDFNGERINPLIYFGYWIYDLVGKIYGIFGDSSIAITNVMSGLYLLFLFVGVCLGIYNYKKWKRLDIYLIVVFFSYALILFLAQNYKMYLKHDHMFLALQGRYLFPVISAGYIIYSKAISFVQSKKIFNILISLLFLLFVLGCSILLSKC